MTSVTSNPLALVAYENALGRCTEVTLTRRMEGCIMVSMIDTNKVDWSMLDKDHLAVERAVEEQRKGLIGNDPRSLIKRAQEIKEEMQ